MSKELWCRAYEKALDELGDDAPDGAVDARATEIEQELEAQANDAAYERLRWQE